MTLAASVPMIAAGRDGVRSMGIIRKALRYLERFVLARQAYKFVLRQWTAPKDLTALADVMASMRLRSLVEPVELPAPAARRILVIAPHPDDEMIGPGGTIIKAIAAGSQVTVLHLTREAGEAGDIRAREAAAVAQRLGYDVASLGIDEGALGADATTLRTFGQAVDRAKPEVVMVPFMLDDHPDHRMASLLLAQAWQDGLIGNQIEVWAYQVYSTLAPNVVVDVTGVAGDKAAAIRMWRESAMTSRDWAHFALGRDAFNLRLLDRPPGPHFAEAFIVLPIGDYAELCGRYRADSTAIESRR